MEVKRDQINKAIEKCQKEGAQVFYSGGVLKIHNKKSGTAKHILIITNIYITFFKFGSNPVESHKNYWRQITSFNYEDKKIELFFDQNPFRFISNKSDEIFDVILEILLRCFTNDELALLDLSRFAHPPLKVNAYGILNRSSMILSSTHTEQTSEQLDDLKKFVKFLQPSFKISGSIRYMSAIMEIIRAAPFLNIVEFDKSQDTEALYQLISNSVKKPSNVHLISLFNKPDIHFLQLTNSIAQSNKSNKTNISALQFNDVQDMDEDDLDRIQKLVSMTKIDSLSFCNSLPETVLNKFTNDLLGSKSFSHLSYLCLDGTKGINVRSVIQNLGQISILSLSRCNLEISTVFRELSESKNAHLRYLNLSHNKYLFNLDDLHLPPYLERIDLNSVEWENLTLSRFLIQLFDQQLNEGIKLFLNKIIFVDDDDANWDSIFESFNAITNYPLVEFSWCHNKISKNLIDFISKNRRISAIFLNGCFDQNDEENLIHFSQILSDMENLSNIVIRGDSKSFILGKKAKIIFEYAKQMNSLFYIDISNNSITDDGIRSLMSLVNECHKLTHVAFDGSCLSDIDCLFKLIDEGEKRKRPLFISWPEKDIQKLEAASKITEETVQTLKEKMAHLSTGITSLKTNAIRSSMQYSSFMSSAPGSPRGSLRLPRSFNKLESSSRKSGRKSRVRDIRTSSFRGSIRPNLLPESSHMQFNPNSPLNKTYEVYVTYYTHKFPRYCTQSLKNIFACNPIQHPEQKEKAEVEEEEEEDKNESKNSILIQSLDSNDLSATSHLVDSTNNDVFNDRNVNTEIVRIPNENDEEEDVIELSLLSDPDIPFIKQLSLPKSVYQYAFPYGPASKSHSKSQLRENFLKMPKLNLLIRTPPILPAIEDTEILEEKTINDDEKIDMSSLKINQETEELAIIKAPIRIDDISDFSSSAVFESDQDSRIEHIKMLISQFKEKAEESQDDSEVYDKRYKGKIHNEESEDFNVEWTNINDPLPDNFTPDWKYKPPNWTFPIIARSTKINNKKYIDQMNERCSIKSLVKILEGK